MLYVATQTRVVKVDPGTGDVTPVAGTDTPGFTGDREEATSSQLHPPTGLAVDRAGENLYVADCKGRVRQINLADNKIKTVVGSEPDPFTEGAQADRVTLGCLGAVAAGPDSTIYVIEAGSFVREVSANGEITTAAGPVSAGGAPYYDDGRRAVETTFHELRGIAADGQSRIYLSDGMNRVRLIETDGVVSTIA